MEAGVRFELTSERYEGSDLPTNLTGLYLFLR